MTEPLSPVAQSVLDAVASQMEGGWISPEFIPYEARKIAAALRAAADQVVPEEPELNPLKAWSVEDWNHMNATKYQREECRRQLLAIAAELEVAQPEGASTYRLLQYIEELSGVLESCAEMIQEWGNYADKYYQEKHCLEADVDYAKSNATRAKRVARQTDNLGEYDD